MTDTREQAEGGADRIRAEWLSTLQELARRRHREFDVRYLVEKHFTLVAAIAAGAIVAAGIAITVAVVRARARRENLFAERVRGFTRAWENPHRLARSGSARPMAAVIARKLAVAAAVALATELTKRNAHRLLATNGSR